MVHWLSLPRRATVDELVAKGRYKQAAAVLRAQFKGRSPTLAERLRLADLLVLSDRGEQALPILLGVADELARYGFNDRALEAIRRADAIAPGHAEVRGRFSSLARAARARIAAAEVAARRRQEEAPPPVDPGSQVEPAFAREPVDLESAELEPVELEPAEQETSPQTPPEREAPPVDGERLAFVRGLGGRPPGGRQSLAAALLASLPEDLLGHTAEGLHRRVVPRGGIVVSEGDSGDSLFLIASGSVRVLVVGGHGRALEIRRLDAGDFFGEVAALTGMPRSATVVAAADCELLEVERWALQALLDARPAARSVLEGAREHRAHSAEEAAVRAIPGPASPDRAAAVLAAHFGGSEWSPRVRLHFAKLMLDAGQENDALAVIASVAEEMAQSGRAETGIAILKKVDEIRRRKAGGAAPRASRAASEAAFRVWVASLAQGTDALMRPAATPADEKGADRRRDR